MLQRLLAYIRSYYAVKFILICMCIILVFGGSSYVMLSDITTDVTEEQLQQVEANAESEAMHLESWISGKKEYVSAISQYITVEDINSQTMAVSNTRNISNSLVDYHILQYQNRSTMMNGTVVTSTNKTLSTRNSSELQVNWGETVTGDPREFDFQSTNDVFISWVYVKNNAKHVAFATPTQTDTTRERVFVAEYNVTNYLEENSVVNSKQDNVVVLGGVSGYYLFGSDSPATFNPYEGGDTETQVEKAIDARDSITDSVSGSFIHDGYVRGYHSVGTDSIGWVVVHETPVSVTLSLLEMVQNDIILLLLIVLFGFLLLIAIVQYDMVKKLNLLSDEASAIANGDEVTVTSFNREDEVGRLASSVQKLSSQRSLIEQQVNSISAKDFDADVLTRSVPGSLGESIETMQQELQSYIDDMHTERQKYAVLVEHSFSGIVVIQDAEFAYINDKFADMVGYEKHELSEISPSDVFYPRTDAFINEDVDAVQNPDSNVDLIEDKEMKVVTSVGEYRVVTVSAVHIDHNGTPAVLINVSDITELDRKNKRLKVFNRVLRHNLRTELQVVSGSLTSIRSRDVSDDVLSDLDRAETHIDNILDTADMARHLKNSFENYHIMTSEIVELLQSMLEKSSEDFDDVEIEYEIDYPVRVTSGFSDAVFELVENAYEHGEPPVTIMVSDCSDRYENIDMVAVSVSDCGDGIPEHEREAFFNDVETNLNHSSGIGLWFVKWTVEIVGGEMVFEDDGSTIVLYIPKESQ